MSKDLVQQCIDTLDALERSRTPAKAARSIADVRSAAARLPAAQRPAYYAEVAKKAPSKRRSGLTQVARSWAGSVVKGVALGKAMLHVISVATSIVTGQADGAPVEWRHIIADPTLAAEVVTHGLTDQTLFLDRDLKILSDDLEARSPSYRMMMDSLREDPEDRTVFINSPGLAEGKNAVGMFSIGHAVHVISVDKDWFIREGIRHGLGANAIYDHMQMTLAHEVGHRAGHLIAPELANPDLDSAATCLDPAKGQQDMEACIMVVEETVAAEAGLPFSEKYGASLKKAVRATGPQTPEAVRERTRARIAEALQQTPRAAPHAPAPRRSH